MARNLALGLALVLALVAAASGQDKKPDPPVEPKARAEGTPLPLNPFAGAKVGDWLTVVTTIAMSAPDGTGEPDRTVLTFRVAKVEGDQVTLVVERTAAGKTEEEPGRAFSKKDATLEQILDMKTEKISDVKVEDEKLEVAGKKLACKKVTFVATDGSGARSENVLWLSSELKPPGIARLTIHDVTNGAHVQVEVAGQGSGDAVDWGKKAIELAPAPPAPPEKPKK